MPAPLNSYLLRSQDTIRPEARVHQQVTETTTSTSTASTSTASTSTSTGPVLLTETISTVTTPTSTESTASTASATSTAPTASTPAVVQVIREVSVNMPSGINLNNYDGKSSASQWWGYFIRWTLIQKMCEQQQCNSFPFFMADGIPKQWFATLSDTVHNSLQLLKDEFFKRFEKSQGLFDVNILQLKQGQKERVDEFMARLQEKTIGQDIPDNIKIGIAIQGFRGEIGKTVHNTFPKPVTLEQLRAIAENAEKSEQLVPAMVAPLDPVIARPELSNLPAIAKLQQNCHDFGNMYKFLTQGILPADNDQSSKVQKSAQDYSICNNVLYKWFQKRVRVDNGEKWIKQLCLPQALREDALLSYHDSLVGGAHLGIERVYHALSLKYFWPKMHQSIENYIRSCDRCQRIKRDTKGKKPPLNPLPVDTTFERWHMDFLKLSKTNEGYSYVLLLVDSFSKWSEAFPMKTQEASEVAKVLFREIISRYGAMKCLVTDLGRNFVSNLVNALCEMLNITRHHTSSYHPQTNGLVERTNSTLIQAVRAYSDKDQNNWPNKLPGILMAFRNSPSTQSTEYSPFSMVFGKEMNLPFDASVLPKDNLSKDAKHHLEEIISNLKITQDLAAENIKLKQAKMKERYDKNTKIPEFRLRDKVLLKEHVSPVGRSPKLVDKFNGPYYITDCGPNFTYKLRRCSDQKEVKAMVNASNLRQYVDPTDFRDPPQAPERPVPDDPPDVQNNQPADNDQDDQIADDESTDSETNSDNGDEPNNANDDTFHEVETLLNTRKTRGIQYFLVKWKDGSKPTWEPKQNIGEGLIQEYYTRKTKKGRRRKQRKYFTRP
ncbi:uncharacterized protein LOC134694358 [Mytilus trossulus]|uniref:uncharacterized protein LOC134694358 n=1 Tax=Mytilus trossulus TaxID=6551 RepID=UPI00300452C8